MLKLYLLPEYGNMQVSSILRKDIINLSRKLLVSGVAKGTGLSPKTVNCVLSLLKGILEYGERENNIPIADVRDIFVKQPQKSMCVLSKKDQEKLTLYLKEHKTPCNMGILLCLYTGLRIGEVCALKWSDIYIEEQNVHVHNTMQRIQISSKDKDHANKTEIVIHKPKSECSIRWIPIPQEICNLLEPFKADDQAFLLTGNKKRYIEPRSMENRFKTVTKECGIDNVNFHALRHTFATRCVELGFDFKSLSEILGHASVNITMNRYVHPSMELKKKNMNLLSELLSNNAK